MRCVHADVSVRGCQCVSLLQEYWVTLPQDPTQKELQLLRAGTAIDGVRVVPKVVQILRRASSSQSDEDAAVDAAAGGPAGQYSSRRGGGGKGGKRESSSSSSSEEAVGMAKGVGDGRREKLSIGGKGCVLRLDVSEGKKHEVRQAAAAAECRGCVKQAAEYSPATLLLGMPCIQPVYVCMLQLCCYQGGDGVHWLVCMVCIDAFAWSCWHVLCMCCTRSMHRQ
jgi:hypothetical protein